MYWKRSRRVKVAPKVACNNQIENYQNNEKLSVCRILLSQRKPKLGRRLYIAGQSDRTPHPQTNENPTLAQPQIRVLRIAGEGPPLPTQWKQSRNCCNSYRGIILKFRVFCWRLASPMFYWLLLNLHTLSERPIRLAKRSHAKDALPDLKQKNGPYFFWLLSSLRLWTLDKVGKNRPHKEPYNRIWCRTSRHRLRIWRRKSTNRDPRHSKQFSRRSKPSVTSQGVIARHRKSLDAALRSSGTELSEAENDEQHLSTRRRWRNNSIWWRSPGCVHVVMTLRWGWRRGGGTTKFTNHQINEKVTDQRLKNQS